ncbi:unnamed protein product, partial [Rotaria sp. Silwood2]
TNRNDSHSWIDQTFSPYNLIEENPGKDLPNKILDTVLYSQDRELNDDEAYYMFRELKTFSIVQLVNII